MNISLVDAIGFILAGMVLTDLIIWIAMPLELGVYENKKGQVFVSQLNVRLMGMMFGGKISEVMGKVGRDLSEVVESVSAF